MLKNYFIGYAPVVLTLLLLASCKKGTDEPHLNDEPAPHVYLDSMFLYAEQLYYWNSDLPSREVYSNFVLEQNNTDELTAAENALWFLTRFARDKQTGLLYEGQEDNGRPKYSAVVKGKTGNTLDKVSGFGFVLSVMEDGRLLVKYVISGSPADQAGIVRGDQIISINGIPYANETTLASFEQMLVNNEHLLTSIVTKNGMTRELSLKRTGYTPNSILKTQLFDQEKTGYIALLDFPAYLFEMDGIFESFQQHGTKRLIIDLRYNSGGYISSCDQMANLIIPSQFDGMVYRKEQYNHTMQSGSAYLLKNKIIKNAFGNPAYYIAGRPATYFDADYSLSNNIYTFEKKTWYWRFGGGILYCEQTDSLDR